MAHVSDDAIVESWGTAKFPESFIEDNSMG
jgi:hypothetical protein